MSCTQLTLTLNLNPGGLWLDWEELQLTSFADWLQMMSSAEDGTARQARFNLESPKQICLYSSNIIVFSYLFSLPPIPPYYLPTDAETWEADF